MLLAVTSTAKHYKKITSSKLLHLILVGFVDLRQVVLGSAAFVELAHLDQEVDHPIVAAYDVIGPRHRTAALHLEQLKYSDMKQ